MQPISERAILRDAGADYNYVTYTQHYHNGKRHNRREGTSSAVADESVPDAEDSQERLEILINHIFQQSELRRAR